MKHIKLWKLEQLERLPPDVPGAVKDRAMEIIETLNRHYGEGRQVDEDLGGHIAIFPDTYQMEDHEALLSRYHLSQADREYQEIVYQEESICWIEELYACGSDYSLVMIRPKVLSSSPTEKKKENGRKNHV